MMRSLLSSVFLILLATTSRFVVSQQEEKGEESLIQSLSPEKHDFVAALTDITFEHQTQASTGQTTGSWLVWFHDSSSEKKDIDGPAFYGEVPTEEEWLEDHVVLGSVEVTQAGPQTAARFGIAPISTPFFLFLHKGSMYRYDKPSSYVWKDIREFCRDPDQTHRGQPIPPPPSLLDDMLQHVQEDPTYALSLIGLVGMSIVGIIFGRGKRTDADAAAKKRT